MLHTDLTQKIITSLKTEGWSEISDGIRCYLLEQNTQQDIETCILDYQPGGKYPALTSLSTEEILVLDGILTSVEGHHPTGSYLRNPKGFIHTTSSSTGCRIFLKRTQENPEDQYKVRISTHHTPWRQGHGNLQVMPLFSSGTEGSALVKWPAGERFVKHTHFGGEEIFVLKGEFIDEFGRYPKHTWIRSPHLSTHFPYVENDTVIFVKTGHLLSL
jgi:anti-sigma factor ChrR (cupin superfamily)